MTVKWSPEEVINKVKECQESLDTQKQEPTGVQGLKDAIRRRGTRRV